jgi:hypothetical protein
MPPFAARDAPTPLSSRPPGGGVVIAYERGECPSYIIHLNTLKVKALEV